MKNLSRLLRKRRLALVFATGVTTSLVVTPCGAQGIPTVDVAGLAQSIMQYTAQLEGLSNELMQIQQLYQQIQLAQQTVAQAQADYQSISGYRNLGDLLNSAAYQAARNYTPADLERALLTPGGLTSTQDYSANLQALFDQYQRSTRLYDHSSLGNAERSGAFDNFNKDEQAAFAMREDTKMGLNAANQRDKELQAFKDRVNQTPDQKSVLDLQANLQSEALLLQNEMLKVQFRRELAAQTVADLERQREEEAIAAAYRSYDPSAAIARARAQIGQP